MKKKIIAIAAIGSILLTGCASQGTGQTPQVITTTGTVTAGTQVISVNSKESVTVMPDMAQVVVGVINQEVDAKTCQDKNTEAVNALIAVLKEKGIAENSIQTSGYNLSTQNDWNNNGEIIGYEMDTELTVKDIPLDQVGDILAASVTSGANQIRSVNYLSSQYDESYQEALAKAVEKSRLKAQALAEASGCTLGPVAGITEYTENQAARYANQSASLKMESASGAGAVADMMPGEIQVEANILVEFEIQ